MGQDGVRVSGGDPGGLVSTNGPRPRPPARIFVIPVVLLVVAISFAVFATMSSASTGTCTINWTGASSSDWGTAGNWTVISTGAHRVPGSSDVVCMSTSPSNTSVDLGSGTTSTIAEIIWPAAGTVQPSLQVDGTLTIGNSSALSSTLNQLTDNGTVDLFKKQPITVGSLTLNGVLAGTGQATSPTLANAGTMTVSGATTFASPVLGVFNTPANVVHLITQGSSSLISAITFYSGSELENQGALTMGDGTALSDSDNQGAQFVNDATGTVSYTATTPGNSANVGLFASNAGTVSVGAGTLFFGGGSSSQGDSGQFTAAANATLDLEGTRSENSGARIAGAGIVDVANGPVTFKTGSQVTSTGTFQVDGTIGVPASTSVSATNLTLNGNLVGPGTLTVSGATTFGPGPALGTFNSPGTGVHLITQGSSTVTGGVSFQGGSELENQGTLTMKDSTSLGDSDAQGNELVNDATATVSYTGSASNQSANVSLFASNAGTVSVGAGTLFFGGGSTSQGDSGLFTAASGATLDLQGTRTENSGATIAGAGTVDVTSGPVTFKTGSQVTSTGTFQVDGTIVVPASTSVSATNLTLNGNLTGPGTLTVSGSTTFGPGPTLGTFNSPGTGVHLITQGSSTVTGGLSFQGGSELENQGTLILKDGTSLGDSDAQGNELVNDATATVSYTGSASNQSANVSLFASNAGTVSVGAGTLFFGGGSSSQGDSGQFTAASGATLDLEGTRSENSGATIAGAGTVDVVSSMTLNNGSQVTNTGTFQVDGTLVVPSATSVSATNLTLNGNVTGPGTLTVSGATMFGSGPSLGTFNVAGTGAHLVTEGSSTLTGGLGLQGGSELENQATLTLKDGTSIGDSDGQGNTLVNDSTGTLSYTGSTTSQTSAMNVQLTNNGTVSAGKGTLDLPDLTNLPSDTLTGGTYNAVGGIISVRNAISTNAASITLGASPSAIQNSGSNALTGLTSNTGSLDLQQTLTLVSAGSLANSGTVTVESGTFSTGTGYSQSAGSTTVMNGATLKPGTNGAAISAGALSGNGAISGKLTGGGNITPQGSAGGPMTVSSTFDNNSGTLTIPVSGTTTAGVDFGQLSATSTATVSGTLAFKTASGFLPPDGTTYTLIQGSTRAGTFSSVTGATLSDRKYVLTYNANNVTATVHYFPTVSGVSPNSGSTAGGNTVTITGQHFQATAATGAATGVSFGGVAATSFTIVDDSHITATVPPGSVGTVDVTVTGPFGTSPTSSADQYTYQGSGLAVTGVNPAGGSVKGGTIVHVTGSGFTGATAVTFGGTAGTKVQVVDDGHITVTSPKHALGTVDVQVTTPSGTSPVNQPADEFTYFNPPTVSSITTPADGPIGGGNTVKVNGTNFVAGQTTVNFGSTPGTNVQVSSSKLLTVVAPAAATAGSVDVTVTTLGGTSAKSAKDLYAYGPPTISSFTPSSGITGSTVTITGSGFAAGITVSLGAFKATAKIVSGTSLTITVPNGDTVASTIKVSDPQGSQTSSTQFTPTMGIKSFSPTSGSISAGTVVTITGVGFSPDSVVAFNKVNASTTFVNSQTLTAVVPAGSSTGLITVTSPSTDNPSGTVTSKSKFTVNP